MYSTARLVAQEVKLPQLPPAARQGSFPPSARTSKPPSRAKSRLARSPAPDIALQVPPNVCQVTREALQSLQRKKTPSRTGGGRCLRERTVTWPAEQYRLWLAASSLPVEPIADRPRVNPRQAVPKLPTAGTRVMAEDKRERRRLKNDPELQPSPSHLSPAHAQLEKDFSRPGSIAMATRLPSRMGRHSLEHYERLYVYYPDKEVRKRLSQPSRLHYQILELKSEARWPYELAGPPVAMETTKTGGRELAGISRGTAKQTEKSSKSCAQSDITPPAPPPNLHPSYLVTSYITPHHTA